MQSWRLLWEGKSRWKTVQYVILAGILGLALLFFQGTRDRSGWPTSKDSADLESDPTDHILAHLEREMDLALTEILGRIKGAGRVYVKVSLAEGPSVVYERDQQESRRITEEQDAQGGTRLNREESSSVSLVLARGSGVDTPVKRQVLAPGLRGVLVVAEGARDPEVRGQLIRAVSVLTDLPVHRIQVVPAG